MTDKATCIHCDRPTCRPEEYEALCAKHYLIAVDEAQKVAAERLQAHLDFLRAQL
jgi:hypothetical protein